MSSDLATYLYILGFKIDTRLIGDIGRRAKDLVQEICGDNGVEILSGKVASNHVHISMYPFRLIRV